MTRLAAVMPQCLTALFVTGLALLGGTCGTRPSSGDSIRPRPNILLVSIDTLRADRVGAYGYRDARTPALDQLRMQREPQAGPSLAISDSRFLRAST